MRQQLNRAIAQEEYEEAARLRDQIRALTAQLESREAGQSAPDAAVSPQSALQEGGDAVNNEDITRRAPEQDVVVFSRVRLARNYADTPFSPKMEAEQARADDPAGAGGHRPGPGSGAIPVPVDAGAQRGPAQPVGGAPPDLLRLAQIRGLVCHLYLQRRNGVGDGERRGHLRIQGMLRGLQLERAAELAFHMEERLSVQEEFAFDAQWGYLTSCPTNTGTGMRACAVVHLPALSASEQINPLAQAAAGWA